MYLMPICKCTFKDLIYYLSIATRPWVFSEEDVYLRKHSLIAYLFYICCSAMGVHSRGRLYDG